MKIKSYKDLLVWKKSHDLTIDVYRTTKSFPREELFGLVSQARRSAVSVSANIVEGHKKPTREFIRYLRIAQGSLEETQYHLLLSSELGYLNKDQFSQLDDKMNEIGKMLSGLRRKLMELSTRH